MQKNAILGKSEFD